MSSLLTSLTEHVCSSPVAHPPLPAEQGIVTSHIVCRRTSNPSLHYSPVFLPFTSLPVSPTSIQQQLARSHGHMAQLPLPVSFFLSPFSFAPA